MVSGQRNWTTKKTFFGYFDFYPPAGYLSWWLVKYISEYVVELHRHHRSMAIQVIWRLPDWHARTSECITNICMYLYVAPAQQLIESTRNCAIRQRVQIKGNKSKLAYFIEKFNQTQSITLHKVAIGMPQYIYIHIYMHKQTSRHKCMHERKIWKSGEWISFWWFVVEFTKVCSAMAWAMIKQWNKSFIRNRHTYIYKCIYTYTYSLICKYRQNEHPHAFKHTLVSVGTDEYFHHSD